MKKIAIIEDEPPLSERYCKVLESAGFDVTPYLSRVDAECGVLTESYDAWVLDIKLGQDQSAGIGLIGTAKENNLKMPILVVSGLDPIIYSSVVYSLGVWDFVHKPVGDETLVFKINQLLEARNSSSVSENSSVDNLEFIAEHPGKIIWKGNKISLPNTAWRFLLRLTKMPIAVVPYNDLFELVKTGANKENARQHIRALRLSMSEFDPDFDHIKSVAGAGYIWKQ